MELTLPILLATAVAAPRLQRLLPRQAVWLLAGVPLAIASQALVRQFGIADGAIETFRAPWIPSMGIDFALRIDGLANLMVLLVSGIGALIVAYADGYLRDHPKLGRFYAFLFVFMAAMLGIATADDLVLLFVFWELTTVSSFLLIGFQHEREASRRAAQQSLIVTGLGGLALLAGFVLLAQAGETSSISLLAERGDIIRGHASYPWILALVLLGAFTKSAQVPFHFWLPGAMQAPTPVSAYLHSSTMVKAGVFLLARLSPTLGGSEAWLLSLGVVGAATMFSGAVLALGQDDLKRLLAYSTVSVLGLLTLLLGLGTPVAARAFVVTLFAHALYKGTLFMVAGNLDASAGTRSLERLGGLRRAMPWTAAAAVIAGISMAGAPPLFGFLAKETAYEAVLEAPRWAPAFGLVAFVSAVCLTFAALRAGFQPFFGESASARESCADPSRSMRLGPVVLACAGLLAGALAGPAERLLVSPAASAILQGEVPTGLALWHGFTPILLMSALTLAAGGLLFSRRRDVVGVGERVGAFGWPGMARVWDGGWQGILRGAGVMSHAVQNGSLRFYMIVTLSVAFGAAIWGVAPLAGALAWRDGVTLSAVGLAAALLIVGGSVQVLRSPTPLTALVALGAVGLGVSLLFLVYSAPDLALTQLVVEVLTVVLMVLILKRLPRPVASQPPRHGRGAIALACVGGLTMAALTLVAFQFQLAEPISSYFSQNSVDLAHGRNVVNVILVDFRALDTLGEITVLAVAALGVLALLASRRSADAETPR